MDHFDDHGRGKDGSFQRPWGMRTWIVLTTIGDAYMDRFDDHGGRKDGHGGSFLQPLEMQIVLQGHDGSFLTTPEFALQGHDGLFFQPGERFFVLRGHDGSFLRPGQTLLRPLRTYSSL